ncbi:MAG TPA: hypothetical protein VK034_14370 [Enhygromyxa sp.]|nr:hypothetical protein [Enhygromyxa sp.]
MEALFGTLALFVFGGLTTYTIGERRHRSRWWRFEREAIEQPESPFRREPGPAPTRELLVRRRAPRLIRRTALWSIYMGQMAVPGGLLGLIGTVFGGLGLVSIPGMMLAVRIWRLGYALLRCDPEAEREALELHRFAVKLNSWAVGIAVLLPLFAWELVGISLVLVVYGAVSFAHAEAMKRCAEILAEERRRREQAKRAAWRGLVEQPLGY